MFRNNVDIDFKDLIVHYDAFLQYASENCDSISFISTLKKPYRKNWPNYEHKEQMKLLEPFLCKCVVGVKRWPGTITKEKRKILLVYRSCKDSGVILRKMPNLLLALENNWPEDMCFYRNRKPWIATVSHEKIAFGINMTESDIAFLRRYNIRFIE